MVYFGKVVGGNHILSFNYRLIFAKVEVSSWIFSYFSAEISTFETPLAEIFTVAKLSIKLI
jgi:hypothetical protein